MGPLEYARALEPLLGQAAAYARSLLGSRQDAEDTVQDAALRGWQRIAQFDPNRPFKGWWFTILRNCCVDTIRRSKTRATLPLPSEDLLRERQEEDWEDLASAIDSLSEIHGEILRLRYFGDLSYADLAEVLAIPKGTVMSRLHLARKALTARMEASRNEST